MALVGSPAPPERRRGAGAGGVFPLRFARQPVVLPVFCDSQARNSLTSSQLTSMTGRLPRPQPWSSGRSYNPRLRRSVPLIESDFAAADREGVGDGDLMRRASRRACRGSHREIAGGTTTSSEQSGQSRKISPGSGAAASGACVAGGAAPQTGGGSDSNRKQQAEADTSSCGAPFATDHQKPARADRCAPSPRMGNQTPVHAPANSLRAYWRLMQVIGDRNRLVRNATRRRRIVTMATLRVKSLR